MDVPTIHAHSHSDKSTSPYVVFMWETMRLLASHPEALKLTVHCIGPTARDVCNKLPNTVAYCVPDTDGGGSGQGGSMAHGVCVEHALAMTDDGDIHLNVDSDTVVLAKGWDDHVRTVLLDEGVGIVGATFEEIGGFSSGKGTSQTFKKIPYTAWMAMSPAHRWRDLRVRPNKGTDVAVTNEGLSKVYNLPVGYSVLCDVGWQIPEYLSSRSISYVGWKHLKGSNGAVVLKGLTDYHEEFHVGDVPFVVHHRGSLRHAYRSAGLSRSFYEAVDAWLAKEKDQPPHWAWRPTAANEPIRKQMLALAKEASERVAAFAKQASAAPAPAETPPAVAAASSPDGGTVAGWLKATIDGNGAWSRYALPVPKDITLHFTPDMVGKHMRLEGTVAGLTVLVPLAADKAYTMTARNMLPGPVVLRALGGAKTVEVPPGRCWLVLVDVDGVVRVE
jgi:hypothetical protein